ncbi:MAG: hypothetical protein JOY78_13430, partial [Pseudonocardia sp.]|nr:hypothetical protein [Pseudonocardia sp.]
RCSPANTSRLTAYFPEITTAVLAHVPAGTVLDGELVVYQGAIVTSPHCKQRITSRPHQAAAASFVVFDVLALAGRDLRSLPYRKRRNGCDSCWLTPARRCC